jgi:hypothetical protein
MPKVTSCPYSLDVVYHGGLSNPSLALAPLTQRLRTKDRLSEALPGSCLVPGISWRFPTLLGWSLGLPGTLWLFADDGRHLSAKQEESLKLHNTKLMTKPQQFMHVYSGPFFMVSNKRRPSG